MAASKSSQQKPLLEIFAAAKPTIDVMDDLNNLTGKKEKNEIAPKVSNNTTDKKKEAAKAPSAAKVSKEKADTTKKATEKAKSIKAEDSANKPVKQEKSVEVESKPVTKEKPLIPSEPVVKESRISILKAPQKQLKSIKLTLLITQKAKDNADRLYKEMGYRSVNDFVNSLLENIDEYME